ncbi:hypothetical protein, partial [Acidovorax sp.]|uniref:hypothetical protein n=1 Tax=Acidovorax sp. TaxID=1872122 RepID=UPI00258AE148
MQLYAHPDDSEDVHERYVPERVAPTCAIKAHRTAIARAMARMSHAHHNRRQPPSSARVVPARRVTPPHGTHGAARPA